MSSVSRTRATNLTGLIDIDALVEANLLRQKTKLNTATQKLKVEQYRQEQYREVITKSKTFYNKYCDILSSGNFLSSSTYNTFKATSSNADYVTAKASTTAKAGSYKVTVTNAAKAPSSSISADDLLTLANLADGNNKITINNKEFTLLKPTSGSDEEKAKQIAEDLNTKLKNAGINVTATFTDLYKYGTEGNYKYGGMIIKSNTAGSDSELLKIGGAGSIADADVGDITKGTDAVYKGVKIDSALLQQDKELEIAPGVSVRVNDTSDLDKIVSDLNSKIANSADYKDKIKASVEKDDSGNKYIKISSTKLEAVNESSNLLGINVKVDGVGISTSEIAQAEATAQKAKLDFTGVADGKKSVIINGKAVNFAVGADNTATISNLNKALKDAGFEQSIKAEDIGGSINLVSKIDGESGNFTVQYRDNTSSVSGVTSQAGTDAKITIKDLTTGASRDYEHASNEIEVDGITFKIDENAKSGETTKITVKADGTELKDKIVEFINDYNELLGHINGKLYETYDRSYLPLTDEDKEGLSDSEIEKLEKKAQTGLLRNDDYLRNFSDDMKLTMTTMLEGSGLSLEKIGINPVNDYSTKNGLFTVDEDELLAAIEENPDGIQELFSGENGIITKLKKNLEEHATSTFSRLANKAGVADGVTANTNEMTKDIEERKKQITAMQTALQEKEDALYVRYSSLESSLASLQAQQSSLSSYFQ